jgi:hypothetical protein
MNKSEPTITAPLDMAFRRSHLIARRAAIASYIDDVTRDDPPARYEYAEVLKRLTLYGNE